MNEQYKKEELIRKICDKKTLDALGILKTINPDKSCVVEERIMCYFQRTSLPIDFEVYNSLIKNIDKESSISFQRRNNSFSLDEIEDEY